MQKYVVECFETEYVYADGNSHSREVLHNVFILNHAPDVCKAIGKKFLMSSFSLDKLDEDIYHVTVTPLEEYCDNLFKFGITVQKIVKDM